MFACLKQQDCFKRSGQHWDLFSWLCSWFGPKLHRFSMPLLTQVGRVSDYPLKKPPRACSVGVLAVLCWLQAQVYHEVGEGTVGQRQASVQQRFCKMHHVHYAHEHCVGLFCDVLRLPERYLCEVPGTSPLMLLMFGPVWKHLMKYGLNSPCTQDGIVPFCLVPY